MAELWQYRDLIPLMARREYKLRFRQTRLGFAWLVINGLLYSGAYTFIFGAVGRVQTDGVNAFGFTLVGMSIWASFSAIFFSCRNFLIGNRDLVTQVYFPRAAIPLGSMLAAQVDTLISLVIIGVVMACTGIVPTWAVLLIPLWYVPAQIMALSIGTLVALLTVGFRDLQNIAAILITFGPIVTPIAYTSSALPTNLRWLATINPLTPLVQGMRWSALNGHAPSGGSVLFSVGCALVLAGIAWRVFNRLEGTVADAI